MLEDSAPGLCLLAFCQWLRQNRRFSVNDGSIALCESSCKLALSLVRRRGACVVLVLFRALLTSKDREVGVDGLSKGGERLG